ncbi:MAG TPA: C4-type zinc ribbon domain-containing protein [Anaerolineales bacterium]|jgi:predicted  nucleic acid-binding Zn-ribbon protein|nr:C4-type zinc ribbon domain-containing protein [Anaerolineales bacterium]
MSASLGLFRLQKVDSRIGQVEAKLMKIREALENDTELRGAMEQVKSAEVSQFDSERARRTSEEEAKAQQIKIQQAESSLYGGAVRNPKELQDLQADIVSLKKHLTTLEDRELEAMATVEKAQATLQTAQEKLEKIQVQRGDEQRKLIDEQESLSHDLESLKTERHAAIETIAGEMLTTYESLRRERRGVAVVEISDNACGACGTTLTAALQQSARHMNQLVHCPSCGRILYAG